MQKLSQDDISKLYADIYNLMKEGVADAAKLGKQAKFELSDCSHNNIIISLCAADCSKRLGVAERAENAEMAELTKGLDKNAEKQIHLVTIPCPAIEKSGSKNDKYSNLDVQNMVRIAAEVYQIANAEKATGKTRIQKHALDFQQLGASLALKP